MATNYDLNITQGSKYEVRLVAKDENGAAINLSGYAISGLVKNQYSDTTSILDLKPSGVAGFIASGYIDIKLNGADTTGLPITQGVYDIEIYSGTYVEKLIYGYANILPEVTR